MQKETSQKSSRSVAASAAFIAMGTLTSRILGLVRDTLTTTYFDRTVTDAWLVAFRLPNLFRRLLGEGSLSVSFIPVFVGVLKNKEVGSQKDREFVSAIFSILLVILTTLTILGMIYSDQIIQWMTPGEAYALVPGKRELTVRFARIMFGFILLVCLYAYFMAILNTMKKFAMAAFAPTFLNLGIIGGVLMPQRWFSIEGEGLAWGVMVGGAVQLGCLIPALKKEGYLPGLNFKWNSKEVWQVFQGMLPSMIGLGIMQMTIIVNTRFASHLPEGTNTWIYLADRVLEFPLSLFAVSLGSALLPSLSDQWAKKDTVLFALTARRALRLILFLSIPAALICAGMSNSIVRILFHHGKFQESDVMSTALVLVIYSGAILTYSLVRVLAPCFYAIRNTWYPAMASATSLLCHLVMAPILIENWGLAGLVCSTVFSSGINLIFLVGGYRYFIGRFGWMELLSPVSRFAIAGAGLWFFLQGMHYSHVLESIGLPLFIRFAIEFSGASLIYLGLCWFLKAEEMHAFMRIVSDKIGRRFRVS